MRAPTAGKRFSSRAPKLLQPGSLSVEAAKGYISPYSGAHFMMLLVVSQCIPSAGELLYPRPFELLDPVQVVRPRIYYALAGLRSKSSKGGNSFNNRSDYEF